MHYHYEMPWVSDEYQTGVASNVFAALDLVADELDAAAEREHEDISAYGDAESYEEAYRAWQACEAINGVVLNIRNVIEQADGLKPRAPLYSGENGYALLLEAAERLARDGFDSLPLDYTPGVWACEVGECEKQENEDY